VLDLLRSEHADPVGLLVLVEGDARQVREGPAVVLCEAGVIILLSEK